MDIHQIQVKYDAMADRLLLQVRTRAGDVVAVWLTRRMLLRLWPPFHQVVTKLAVARTAPDATVLPEAREMLAQAARERPLPNADFSTRFDNAPAARPLGPEPLLPAEISLSPVAAGGLLLKIREERGRGMELRLGDDLACALMRLLEKALAAAAWGVLPAPSPAAEADTPLARGPLN